MKERREDILRVATDILQERGVELDQAELRRLVGGAPATEAKDGLILCVSCGHVIGVVAEVETPPPPEKWPPLDNGTVVRTRLNPSSTDWTEHALRHRRDGVLGVIIGYHDSHGLSYEVRHIAERPPGWLKRTFLSPYALAVAARRQVGCYEPDELVVVR